MSIKGETLGTFTDEVHHAIYGLMENVVELSQHAMLVGYRPADSREFHANVIQWAIHAAAQVHRLSRQPPAGRPQHVRNARMNSIQRDGSMPIGKRACRPLGRCTSIASSGSLISPITIGTSAQTDDAAALCSLRRQ
jgi:hypothetical protein